MEKAHDLTNQLSTLTALPASTTVKRRQPTSTVEVSMSCLSCPAILPCKANQTFCDCHMFTERLRCTGAKLLRTRYISFTDRD